MGSSASAFHDYKLRELEDALQAEKNHRRKAEASLQNERDAAKKLWYSGQIALVIGTGAAMVAVAGLALLAKKQTAAAVLAAERRCATQHEVALGEVRRRAAIELQNAQKFAVETFARDLLPVVDSLEHALQYAGHEGPQGLASTTPCNNTEALADGVALTEQKLLHVFQKHGIEKQGPLGQRFDPNVHEAVLQVSDGSYEPGHVATVHRSGFSIHTRVLRAAQVSVATRKPHDATSPTGGPACNNNSNVE